MKANKMQYFNINLEFDKIQVDRSINETILNKGKGYVCSVDGNILAVANTNEEFNKIVNNSLVNICDGSSIALLSSLIHRKKLTTYIGADLFIQYIKKAKYKSFFLGNTNEVLQGLKEKLVEYDPNIENMIFETLPFKDVNDFNYLEIANQINHENPDIIWVSLGAPKQEVFMSKLLPHLNRGVMFGFGAILNFYSNHATEKRAPKLFLKLKMEWFYRLYCNPKKQLPKFKLYLKTIPIIAIKEIKKTYFK